jgi:WD40 repeat protein
MPIDFLFPPPEPVNWALLMVAVAIQAATLSLLWRLERESIRQPPPAEADMNAEAPEHHQRRLRVRSWVMSGFSLLALLLEIRFSSLNTVWNVAVFAWMVLVVGSIGWYFFTGWTARHRIVRGAIMWAILGAVPVFVLNRFGVATGFMNPLPVMRIPIANGHISDLQFSPDGPTLAVTQKRDETRIFRVSDGTLLQKLPGGGLRCAWNSDGSWLAVARSNWPDIELWETGTRRLRKRLSLYDPKKGQPKSEEPYGRLYCFSLCFDRWNNLFVAEEASWDWEIEPPGAFPHEIPRAAVFWRASDDRSEIPANRLLAVASVGDVTRLAYAGFGVQSTGVEIWSVQTPKSGFGMIRQKFVIGQLQEKDASVSFSADGKYLVAASDNKFLLLEMFDDRAAVILSQEIRGDFPVWPTTDVAADGSVAALRAADWVKVLEIPSGRTLLEIKRPLFESQRTCWISLSPDGRLLATTDWERRSVLIYQVPR